MINEDIRHSVEAELREGEELLWADRPNVDIIKRKAIYVYGFTLFLMLAICIFVVFLNDSDSDAFVSIVSFVTISGIAFWVVRKSVLNELDKANNIYAVTSKVVLIKGSSKKNKITLMERIPFEEIKHVHEKNIAGGKSITLVLKGGPIPNIKNIIIDGLPKESSVASVIKRKISFL